MTKKYVFSSTQFTRVVLAGMSAAGQIPESLIKDGVEKNTNFEHTENGVIITIDAPESKSKGKVRDAGEAVVAQAVTETEGPSPETVKAALEKVMEHPPWMNSINSWTPKQRKTVLKWAKAGGTDQRPDFVKERLPRGSKKGTAAAASEESVPPVLEAPAGHGKPVANGKSPARDFFEREEAENQATAE